MKVEALYSPVPFRISGIYRFLAFIGLMLYFVFHHTLADILIRQRRKKMNYFIRSVSKTSRLALRVLNVKVTREGSRGEVKQRLIVANHLSYLDVLILASEFPAFFITSVEIRETFFLGPICRLAGCFFVERRKEKRNNLTKIKELSLMKKQVARGFNVFLFPEGTSSDGRSVLPFKATFFQLAVDTGTPIVPVCLKYTGSDYELPPWYGDMTFIDHLFNLCQSSSLEARLTLLPEINGEDKFLLAESCHSLIKAEYEKP